MNSTFKTAVIYILHITDTEGRSARLGGRYSASHYVGKAVDIRARLREHRSGRKASVITRECLKRGLDFRVARVILVPKGEAGLRERRLKGCAIKRSHCPVCRIERETEKLGRLLALEMSAAVKQKITKARRAIESAVVVLREAQAISHLVGQDAGWHAQEASK